MIISFNMIFPITTTKGKQMFKVISTITILGIMFFSVPSFAKPIELHYWHGHTGKLENIINNIADRWNIY